MAKTNDMFKIDLNQIYTYDEDAPVSANSLPSKQKRLSSIGTARTDPSQPATERNGRDHWRKVVNNMAPKTSKTKPGKVGAQSPSPRRRTKTESLIVMFLARKRRLDSDAENGFEDPEYSVVERNSPRCQSKEQVVSINLADVYLSESSNADVKTTTSPRDRKISEAAASTSPIVESSADDVKPTEQEDSGENVAPTRRTDGVSVCDKSAQTVPQVTTPHGRYFVGHVPTRGRTRGDSVNLEHAIHMKGFSCHDRPLREAGYVPRLDHFNPNNIKWVKERIPADGGSSVAEPQRHPAADSVKTVKPQHGKKKTHSILSTREKVATKAKAARPRTSYEKLLHYLTLVRDYPEAFEKLRQLAANESTTPGSVSHLRKLGHAFTTGHLEFSRRETPVQIAAYELGSRQKLIACAKPPKEAVPSLPLPTAHGALGKHAKSRIHSAIATETDSNEASCIPDAKRIQAQHGPVVAGLWRTREDAEKALASVSTYQGRQETEKALKELGETEGSQQQWWVSQKDCRYLRSQCTTNVSY